MLHCEDLVYEIAKFCCLHEQIHTLALASAVLAKCVITNSKQIAKMIEKYPCGDWDDHLCSLAARKGHLLCLKYAHENGYYWDEDTCASAVEVGNLPCLQHAYENGCPWDEDTCTWAATVWNSDCLEYAHKNGCPWNAAVTLYAAGYGSLECLQYAHENNCPWHENTCAEAACHGYIDCLRYAYEQGCSWDEWTLHSICVFPNIFLAPNVKDCVMYAIQHGCPVNSATIALSKQTANSDTKYAKAISGVWKYYEKRQRETGCLLQ